MSRTRLLVSSMLAASMATAAVGAGLALAAGGSGASPSPILATAKSAPYFSKATVTVKPGATVYWKTTDSPAPHDAVAVKKIKGKPAFTSGAPSTKTFKAKAPTTPGTYAYICTVHPFMKGTLIVKK